MSFALNVSGEPASNVVSGKVTLTKGALTLVQPVTLTDHTGTLTFSNVQVGTWAIAAQLFDASGVEIYSGSGTGNVVKSQTTTVTIKVNHNTGSLQIIIQVPTEDAVFDFTFVQDNTVFFSRSDGTGLRQLTAIQSSNTNFSVSNAGNARGGNLVFGTAGGGNYMTFKVGLDGTGFEYLPLDSESYITVKWALDGTQLAGIRYSGQWEIVTFKPTDTNLQSLTLTNTADWITGLAWTPDNQVVYARGGTIYKVDAANTQKQTVVTLNTYFLNVDDCSVDGTVVFRDANFTSYTVHSDGTGLTQISDAPTYDSAFSADGQKILCLIQDTTDSNPSIFIMNRDGSGKKKILGTSGFDHRIYTPRFVY